VARSFIAALVAVLAAAPVSTEALASPQERAGTAGRGFTDLARSASAAREAGRLDEAARLYRRCLQLRPDWAEGLGFLGAIAYEQDRFAECQDAFRRLVALEPKAAPAWALRGLCEFGLKQYAPALRHLDRALSLGGFPDEAMERVALYHQALLRIRAGRFDLAIAPLTALLRSQQETPELVTACGLLLLRRSQLPEAVAAADRPLMEQAGAAYCAHLARRPEEARSRYQALLARWPRQRHLHYGFGLALAQAGSAEAIAQFRREIELSPDHLLARLELAFALLTHGRAAEAAPVAKEAVRLAPSLFAAHTALGRALVETGDLAGGIAELETAIKLEPKLPEAYLFLGRAYAKAGRTGEAERAQAVFKALDDARRRAAETAGGPTRP
jgi:tetratricopeptide (TPR) repeat protein